MVDFRGSRSICQGVLFKQSSSGFLVDRLWLLSQISPNPPPPSAWSKHSSSRGAAICISRPSAFWEVRASGRSRWGLFPFLGPPVERLEKGYQLFFSVLSILVGEPETNQKKVRKGAWLGDLVLVALLISSEQCEQTTASGTSRCRTWDGCQSLRRAGWAGLFGEYLLQSWIEDREMFRTIWTNSFAPKCSRQPKCGYCLPGLLAQWEPRIDQHQFVNRRLSPLLEWEDSAHVWREGFSPLLEGGTQFIEWVLLRSGVIGKTTGISTRRLRLVDW